MGKSKITVIPESIRFLKISDEEYFGNPEYKNYISNSKLKLINPDEGGSPELWENGILLQYSESFEVGTAVHAILLQPNYFYISNIRKPSGKLGLFANKVYDYKQNPEEKRSVNEIYQQASIDVDYYSGKLSEKRLATALETCIPYWKQRDENKEILSESKLPIYLSEKMFSISESCMNEISSNSQFKDLLYPEGLINNPEYYNEYAILCDILVETEEYSIILPFKLKLDNFTIDFDNSILTLNDLKTTGKPADYFMGNKVKSTLEDGTEYEQWYDGSFQKYHYYRQLAVYLWILQCYIQKEYGIICKSKANILLVETIPEFKSRICPISNAQIQKGLKEIKNLLILVADLEWKKKK